MFSATLIDPMVVVVLAVTGGTRFKVCGNVDARSQVRTQEKAERKNRAVPP
jgi:hypothetical protein